MTSPGHLVGRLLVALALLSAAQLLFGELASALLPENLGAGRTTATLSSAAQRTLVVGLVPLLLVFPAGVAHGRVSRWLLRLAFLTAGVVCAHALFSNEPNGDWPVSSPLAVASAAPVLDAANQAALVVLLPLFVAALAGIGVAVLRYRLYDIDRIVSRTVGYAFISALIALPYLAIVTVVTRVASSDLAVALATLGAAAVFQPVRRRVQGRVDQRFNRARYDAQRTVDAFRARLRDDVVIDDLRADLLAVVGVTMQLAGASLWLRAAA